MPYPKAENDSICKTVLINQFHDILPRSAIKEDLKRANIYLL